MRGDADRVLATLVDEAAIHRLLYTHCRALDRCDGELLLSLYDKNATHAQGPFQGLAEAFVPAAVEQMRTISHASHHATNILIDIDGDEAQAETYYINFAREQSDVSDRPRERIVTGRTLDTLVRRSDGWKIKSRIVVYDGWHLVDTVSGADDPKAKVFRPQGRRDADDPLFSFMGAKSK